VRWILLGVGGGFFMAKILGSVRRKIFTVGLTAVLNDTQPSPTTDH